MRMTSGRRKKLKYGFQNSSIIKLSFEICFALFIEGNTTFLH